MSVVKSRNRYSLNEDVEIWRFVIEKLKTPNYEPVKSPCGNKLWEDYKKETNSPRTVLSLGSHFRKYMPKNLLRLSLPKDDVKLVFKEFNWPMTKDEEDVLQMKVEKKYAFNAEDEIVPTITCSDGISESQDTPLSRHQRTRQPTAVSLADDAPSGKKRRLESFPSNAETEMNNVFETKSVHEDTSDSLTNVSNSNSPHPAVENDPMSDLDDELWINVNNSPKKGRRFPQIRPAHINLDTPPNNEIPSCSNLLDEAQSTTENIQSIFDNTIKDMLKQANRSDILLDDLIQIPIIKELKRNIEQGVEFIKSLESKDLKEVCSQTSDPFIM